MTTYLLSDVKFWIAVAFIILIIFLFKPIKKLLLSALDEKISSIIKNIKEAEDVKQEAKNLFTGIKKRSDIINNEILHIQQKIRKKIDITKNEMMKKFEIQLHKHKNSNILKIQQMEQETINSLKEITINLTINTTKQLINNNLDSAVRDKIINQSVKEFKNKLKN